MEGSRSIPTPRTSLARVKLRQWQTTFLICLVPQSDSWILRLCRVHAQNVIVPIASKTDNEMQASCVIIRDFLHRSLCRLLVLSICNWDSLDAEAIRALLDVLKITPTLQQPTLQPIQRIQSSESCIRRLSSRNQNFLPCLQTFSLRTAFVPPFDLCWT